MDDLQASMNDPTRPLDWRYQAAAQAADGNVWLGRHNSDPSTRQAAVLLRAQAACRGPTDRQRLRRRYSEISQAMALGEQRAAPLRLQLEAWMASGESAEEIAARTGLSASVLAAYEALFFDVRTRLHRPGLIIALAVERARRNPAGRGALYPLLVALTGGPAALARLEMVLRTEGAKAWQQTIRRELTLLQWLDARQEAYDSHAANTSRTAQARRELPEIDDEDEEFGGGEAIYLEHMQAMSEAVGKMLTVGQGHPHPEVRRLERNGAMLTEGEAMLVSAGYSLPNEAEILSMEYPDEEEEQADEIANEPADGPSADAARTRARRKTSHAPDPSHPRVVRRREALAQREQHLARQARIAEFGYDPEEHPQAPRHDAGGNSRGGNR